MALFGKPKYTSLSVTHESQQEESGSWFRCKNCAEFINKEQTAKNNNVCIKCNFHYPLNAHHRIELITDKNSFEETLKEMQSVDVLNFQGYKKTLSDKQKKTKLNDAVVTGFGKINKIEVGIGVMDFRFMGASMGSVVGEKLTCLIEEATERKAPVLLITASGGARMQEGCVSLMQMAKVSGALALHSEQNLSSICLLTHPTFGGVTASFASLGDLIIAEPKALIGFAGARVIKSTIQAELPEDFQTAEFLEKHGLIDRIIHRDKLKEELGLLLEYLV